MKNNGCKRAFTLIELLVVVLIIGILAAIALPQYLKAVAKARTAEAITWLGNAQRAVSMYLLQNGGLPSTAGNPVTTGLLDIDLTNGLTCGSVDLGDITDACYNKNFTYVSYCSSHDCFLGAYQMPNGDVGQLHGGALFQTQDGKTWTPVIVVYTDAIGKPSCQMFAQHFGGTCEQYSE